MLQGKRISSTGRIPPCHGFRLEAEPGGSTAAAVCRYGRGRDELGTLYVIPGGAWIDLGDDGPYWIKVDPDGVISGGSWLATWAEHPTAIVRPAGVQPDTLAPNSGGSALRVARKGIVLYDSGSVAAGAAISSGVLDLTAIETLEVIVDNTAASVFRDLSLVSYLDDGTTQIDSVLLRKVGYGSTAPTGGQFSNGAGAARGLIGAVAPGGVTGTFLLYDKTENSTVAHDTGALNGEEIDNAWGLWTAAGGSCIVSVASVDDDATVTTMGNGSANANGEFTVGLGSGTVSNWSGGSFQCIAALPRRWKVTATANATNAVRLRVWGKGRIPGTFSVPMVLPTRAKLTLGAAGAAAARLTVIGR